MRDVRSDFPLLQDRGLVYLDSAATSQKPRAVLQAMDEFYQRSNANVRRGVHRLAEEATAALEEAREAVRRFLSARSTKEIIFTRGATESINLVAQGWAGRLLSKGDEIAVTEVEHHSNFVPWQRAARATGASLRVVGAEETRFGPRTRVLALSHVSNALGTILPAARMARAARASGAVVLIDAAQSVPHLPVSVAELGCDFLAFSGHKMLGPTGIGVLWARPERLQEMEPLLTGGGMVLEVSDQRATWLEPPAKFEAGTPPIAEAVGLRAAIEYLEKLGMGEVRAHERELIARAFAQLAKVPDVVLYGPEEAGARSGIISFNLRGVHPHDLATFLDARGICVRAGNHCAQPLMRRLGVSGTVRASLHVYSSREDVDALAEAVAAARELR
ncbi:MAG: SufS family cysteine desulfurase [Deltaproteobacteria bacterium]|nr:MAG: SufS family cysteine desulfurase [Deltaproteobacteria bacterium]